MRRDRRVPHWDPLVQRVFRVGLGLRAHRAHKETQVRPVRREIEVTRVGRVRGAFKEPRDGLVRRVSREPRVPQACRASQELLAILGPQERQEILDQRGHEDSMVRREPVEALAKWVHLVKTEILGSQARKAN